jgi:hypothetical protein
MKSKKQKVYKFHFKMDEEMYNNLNDVSLCKKNGGISRLINKILTLLSPGMEQKHLHGKQMMSRYTLVHEDMEVGRKNIFVYLPDHRYRRLKLLHQDLNYYSMAQLLRLILSMFLDFAREFGDDVEGKLWLLYHQWKAKRKLMKYRWKPVKELLHFIYQKPRISRFLTLYSNKFQPISIYRL